MGAEKPWDYASNFSLPCSNTGLLSRCFVVARMSYVGHPAWVGTDLAPFAKALRPLIKCKHEATSGSLGRANAQ
eukprot:408714-Amphidinium_carterae.2